MTTEKELATSHPGFWRTILPLSESFVRTMNRALDRYAPPLHSSLPPDRRGLVNEAAFRVFAASVAASTSVRALEPATIDAAWIQGIAHVRTMRQFSRAPVAAAPERGEVEEAVALAERIALFFLSRRFSQLAVEPSFRGCGWIDEAKGDVFADRVLFEIKAGERQFRSVDLHQLLAYCALNFATKALDITSVGLINPRTGTFTMFDLDALCNECAGTCAADVLDEILQYFSEPLGAYGR